jgi:hypothetical protein
MKMPWNYRIVKYKDGSGYGLHEVLYDDEGQPWAMTNDPIGFSCRSDEGPQGIRTSLLMARVDAIKRPVFDEPKKWPGKNPAADLKPSRRLKPRRRSR